MTIKESENIDNGISTDETILGTKNLRSLLIQYCVPAIVAMIVTGLQGMIDGLYVGNVLGASAMASVNLAIPFIQIIVGLTMVVSIGGQSHIGIKFGMGKTEEGQDTFRTFLIITICATLIITITGVIGGDMLASLFGADESLQISTAQYIQTMSMFACPMALLFYFGFLNRVIGMPELYFKASLVGLCGNVVFNYIFIVMFGWGIQGAALATGGAYTVGLLLVVRPILSNKYNLGISKGKWSTVCIRPVLFNGASEGVNSVSVAVTAYLFNMALMREAGPTGVAVFTAVNYVGMLGTMILFGISDGIGPITSYNYGHNKPERVKAVLKAGHLATVVIGGSLFLVLFLFGEEISGLFLKDEPELIKMAGEGAKIYGLAFLLMGYNIVNSGFFTFIGKGLESVVVAASRGLVFVVLGISIFPSMFGIQGVWMCVPFAELMAAIIGLGLLKKASFSEKSIA